MKKLIYLEDAIDEIARWIGYLDEDIISRIQLGLKRLPLAQPEQTDCIYCHENSDGYVTPLEKNCHAFIRFGMNGWELDLKAKRLARERKNQVLPDVWKRFACEMRYKMINEKIVPISPYGFRFPTETEMAIDETLKLCGIRGEEASMMFIEVMKKLGKSDEIPPCCRGLEEKK